MSDVGLAHELAADDKSINKLIGDITPASVTQENVPGDYSELKVGDEEESSGSAEQD